MNGIVQLPPYFREAPPVDRKVEAHPWHVTDMEMEKHWLQTGAGEGILVGIADTGLDVNHQEISGRVTTAKGFGYNTYADGNDHGTHVTTTIAGSSVGMAPKCSLAIAKVLADNGSGSSKDVADGIDWLVEQGCHIISMSLGGPEDDPWTSKAVKNAIASGVLVFAATGNEHANVVGYPARHCVGIGAVDRKFRLAYFSNRGKDVDLVGFGVELLAGIPGNKYQSMSGTSMATPFIAGLAANRLSAEQKHLLHIVTRNAKDLLKLESYVKDLGVDGQDTSYGRGFPDLNQAFYQQLENVPGPIVTPPPAGSMVGTFEDVATGRMFKGVLTEVKGAAEMT